MAARRLARSAIDWAKYSKMVMEHDRQQFETFRSLCQQPLLSISSLPEKLPDIDWNYYKEKVAGFYNVSEFETKYKALNITPAKQPDHLLKQIDDAEKEDVSNFLMMVRLSKFLAANEAVKKKCEDELSRWAKVPPVDHWMPEEYEQYVPSSRESCDLVDYIRYDDPVEQYLDLGYRRIRCMKEEEGDFNGYYQQNLQAMHPSFLLDLFACGSNVVWIPFWSEK
ncbi:hypothetical protein D918_00284 [Trichuris suis]|nr:hypothetical protein D918_00284 [Trichuris suis]